MSSNRSEKNQYAKKILKMLSSKPAISIKSLVENIDEQKKEEHSSPALLRSLKGLKENGLIQYHDSGQQQYVRITPTGRRRALSLKLADNTGLINPVWDKRWRIIILDIPEDRKAERDSLRYLLKKAGFVCLKNSVWISTEPFEHMFTSIKKDLGLTTEMMIFVSDTIDNATQKAFAQLTKAAENITPDSF